MGRFCKWLLYKHMGWTKNVSEDHPEKFIICLAPHTSNWDFMLGQLYMRAEGMKINFLMKKEWFFWPLGPIFRRMGGIPVWRTKKTSMTDNLASEAKKAEIFHLCITPEGSTQTFIPTGDVEGDMRKIKLYFKDYKGKHPELFTIGECE